MDWRRKLLLVQVKLLKLLMLLLLTHIAAGIAGGLVDVARAFHRVVYGGGGHKV